MEQEIYDPYGVNQGICEDSFIDEAYYMGRCLCKLYIDKCGIYQYGFKNCSKLCFHIFLKNIFEKGKYEKYLKYYYYEGFLDNLLRLENFTFEIEDIRIIEHIKINIPSVYEKYKYSLFSYNLSNGNCDVVNFMINDIKTPELINHIKNIRFEEKHIDVIEILINNFPDIFDFYGERELYCEYEIARRLIILNCGRKINPINIKNKEFLWNYRDFIGLHDFVINYSFGYQYQEFLFLAFCCLDYNDNQSVKEKVMKYFPKLDTREKIIKKLVEINRIRKIGVMETFINIL